MQKSNLIVAILCQKETKYQERFSLHNFSMHDYDKLSKQRFRAYHENTLIKFIQIEIIVSQTRKGAYFKDDRNFSAFLTPSERKMTSLLLILTAFGRPPSSRGCVHH